MVKEEIKKQQFTANKTDGRAEGKEAKEATPKATGATPSPANTSPSFHPKHAVREEGYDVVLRAKDGVRFWYSSVVLKSYSTFFADLESLFDMKVDGDATSTSKDIELPSATSLALHIILSVAIGANATRKDFLQELQRLFKAEVPDVLYEIYEAADAYGFAQFNLIFAVYSPTVDNIWTAAAVCLIGSRDPMEPFHRASLVPGEWGTVPVRIPALIERFSPYPREHIRALQDLEAADQIWKEVLDDIRAAANNTKARFDPLCVSKRCEAYREFDGDWKKLIQRCAAVATQSMQRAPYSTECHRHMAGAVFGTAQCQTCGHRIKKIFGDIITDADGLDQAPKPTKGRGGRGSDGTDLAELQLMLALLRMTHSCSACNGDPDHRGEAGHHSDH